MKTTPLSLTANETPSSFSLFQFPTLTLATASLSAWNSIMLAPIPAPCKNAVAAVPSATAAVSSEEEEEEGPAAAFLRGMRTGSGGSVIVLKSRAREGKSFFEWTN